MADETKQEEAAPSDDAPTNGASEEAAADESTDAEAQTQEAEETASSEEEVAGAERQGPAEETAAGEATAEETATQTLALPEPPEEGEGRNFRKERVGTVESAKMEKTIVVSIERQKKHAMYSKYLTRTSRLMVHDENNDAGEGDTVLVMETRPLSKHKRWRLLDILERAK